MINNNSIVGPTYEQSVDDICPADSISNAPFRRGSDMSGYTEGNAYMVLDLPDLSSYEDRQSALKAGTVHKTTSAKSIGDIAFDRKSSLGSAVPKRVCYPHKYPY